MGIDHSRIPRARIGTLSLLRQAVNSVYQTNCNQDTKAYSHRDYATELELSAIRHVLSLTSAYVSEHPQPATARTRREASPRHEYNNIRTTGIKYQRTPLEFSAKTEPPPLRPPAATQWIVPRRGDRLPPRRRCDRDILNCIRIRNELGCRRRHSNLQLIWVNHYPAISCGIR